MARQEEHMKVWEGSLVGEGVTIGIVVSRFNEFITRPLLEGALGAAKRHGINEENIEVVWVPGAFEIPVTLDVLAQSRRFHALIALGAVIRGATAHFDYVAGEAAKGTLSVSLKYGLPVIFGILTVDTIEQAIERAGTKAGNKGYEAMVTAIEMADVIKQLKEHAQSSQR